MTDRRGDGIPIDGPDGSGALRRFGVRGFAALWRHERVLAADLADDPTVVQTLIGSGRVEVDDDGVLVAVHGLVDRPTRHRIEHDDDTINTWCALDAIGIPAALGITADAVTSCATCAVELRVHLDGGAPEDRPHLALWLPATDCGHLVNDFCAHANLYCTRAHLTTDVPSGARGGAISVVEVADIGRATWADIAKEIDR